MSMSIDLSPGTGLPSTPHADTDSVRNRFAVMGALLGLDSTEGLTAEFLVQLANQRLSSIDGQIKYLVDGMNARSEVLDHARCASSLLEEWRTEHAHDDHHLNFDEERTVTNPDGSTRTTTLGAELEAIGLSQSDFVTLDGDHHAIGPDHNTLEGLTTAIRNKTEQLQQGSEIEQMRLQQLVQARGQFVQMCSQVMSSMHETEKGITSNIRG